MTDNQAARPVIVPCASCAKLNRVDLARTDATPSCGACHAPIAVDAPMLLTDGNFDRVVNASGVPIIVDFYADWCGPCKMMAPLFAELARRHKGTALVAKLDTERSPAVAMRFAVRSIPTIVVLQQGRETARQVGAVPMPVLEQLLRS